MTEIHHYRFVIERALIMDCHEFMAVVLILSINWAGKDMTVLLEII